MGRVSVLTRRVLERAALTLSVLGFFVTGYFAVGLNADPARARDLGTVWDAGIPFSARWVWVYLWVFPASLLPLFVVRCPRLFRRTILAYGIAIAASLTLFVAIPVTSIGLRVERSTLEVTHFSPWAVSLLYDLDPPFNLFPSLHLTIAALSALSAWKARRIYGAAAFVGVTLIGVSICAVKQHFVLDGLGGIALAAVVHALILHPYGPEPGNDPAYGWRGPAIYAALWIVVYFGFYVGFRVVV